jgi:galactose-1-phosphate uridylyltransferase
MFVLCFVYCYILADQIYIKNPNTNKDITWPKTTEWGPADVAINIRASSFISPPPTPKHGNIDAASTCHSERRKTKKAERKVDILLC